MIKDIPKLAVQDVALAVVSEPDELGNIAWNVYVLNLKDEQISGVLVTSRGYGEINSEQVKTSTLRHFIEDVPPKSYALVEPIMDSLFGINNEYWLSFYLNGNIYDKKYVFVPESITEGNFVNIPLVDKQGVMIK